MNINSDFVDINKTYLQLSREKNYDYFNELGQEIIKSIKNYGLGVLPKADLEGLIFHSICNAIEGEFVNDIKQMDYALMQMLKISPSKLRSLRIIRSTKYLDLDYNSKENRLRLIIALKHVSICQGDFLTRSIKISISDPHVQRLLERMIEDNKGVLDFTFNPKLLVLNAKEFLEIVAILYGKGAEDGYEKTLQAIKKETKKLHNELTKDNIWPEFKDAFKDKALEEMVNVCLKILKKVVKNKLGL